MQEFEESKNVADFVKHGVKAGKSGKEVRFTPIRSKQLGYRSSDEEKDGEGEDLGEEAISETESQSQSVATSVLYTQQTVEKSEGEGEGEREKPQSKRTSLHDGERVSIELDQVDLSPDHKNTQS